jgi:hypothetical protein
MKENEENEGKRKGNKGNLMENKLNARKWQKTIGKEGKRKGNKEKQKETKEYEGKPITNFLRQKKTSKTKQ